MLGGVSSGPPRAGRRRPRRGRRSRTRRTGARRALRAAPSRGRSARPAAIGSAFVQNDERPAVASARPRWKASWIRVNASPVAGPDREAEEQQRPAVDRLLRPDVGRRVHAARRAIPKPAPGARREAAGPIEMPTATNEITNQAATAIHEPVLALARAAGERDRQEDEPDDREPDAEPLASAAAALLPRAERGRPAGRAHRRRPPGRARAAPAGARRCRAPSRRARSMNANSQRRFAEEEPERPPRVADRQRRELRGDRVLRDPRPVERGRSNQGQDQPQDRGGAHLDRSSGVRAHRRATPDPGHSTRLRRGSHPSGRGSERHRRAGGSRAAVAPARSSASRAARAQSPARTGFAQT